jgi:hypothetical protein
MLMVALLMLNGEEEFNALTKIVTAFFAALFLVRGIIKLHTSQHSEFLREMSTTMLKIRGTPGAIFYNYLLRSMLLPGLVLTIIWVGNFEVNTFWGAVFAIYCFLWGYDIIRMVFQSIKINRNRYAPANNKGGMLIDFILAQHMLLLLPALGLFIMWYFDFLPMPTWTFVLYCIYGGVWLIVTISILVAISEGKRFNARRR